MTTKATQFNKLVTALKVCGFKDDELEALALLDYISLAGLAEFAEKGRLDPLSHVAGRLAHAQRIIEAEELDSEGDNAEAV